MLSIKKKKYGKEYWKYDRGDRKLQSKRYTNKYPKRIPIYQTIYWAVKNGTIIKPERCTSCDRQTRLNAYHHNGYNDPFHVIWLCNRCMTFVRKNGMNSILHKEHIE